MRRSVDRVIGARGKEGAPVLLGHGLWDQLTERLEGGQHPARPGQRDEISDCNGSIGDSVWPSTTVPPTSAMMKCGRGMAGSWRIGVTPWRLRPVQKTRMTLGSRLKAL